jgi:predicted NBD/HSP70 family sugar kinase
VPDLRVSLVDLGGDVLDESRIALEAGDCRAAAAAVADCAARARRVAQERGIRLWQAVGAFPGLIDPRGETVCQAVNLPALDGLPFRRLLAAQGLAARAVSLGLCFFLGETAARPPGDAALVVHWDLGVGAVGGNGDTILGTRLGADGAAEIVELGHVCIAPGGRRCRCGGRGCLEAYAGGNAILARLRSGAIRGLPHLLDALAAGQPAALAAMRNAARLLGRNLSWPLQLSGAGQLILTGPLSAAFARFSPALQAGLAEGLPPERLRALKVVASSDPTRNLRTGAFRLAMLLLLDPEAATRLPRSPMRLIHSAAP